MKLSTGISIVLTILVACAEAAGADVPKLDSCDVTWLWPVPQTEQDLEGILAIGDLKTPEGGAVWSDEQFEDVLKTADGDFAVVQNHRVRLPAEVRKKSVWRIVAFRADPCAPGGHEAIRKDFGEKPQLRLILQPVTVNQGAVTVHDIAVHAVFTFVIKGEGQAETPDRKRFQDIVHDLDALKAFSSDAGITTSGRPLGVHPGLAGKLPGLREKVRAFLEKHLNSNDLSAMAIMALDGAEPWIFTAMGRVPPAAPRFAPISFLPAQMLSFRSAGGSVLPPPKVNNLNPIRSKLVMPSEAKDRRGVATAALFPGAKDQLNNFAEVGKDAQGKAVLDGEVRNRDIPDVVADPTRSHFFNTDCLSCHTETRRRLRLGLEAGTFAYRHGGRPPEIDPSCLPKDDWNVRNLGWFPPHRFIGGGPTVPTITQRTANETAEVVEFIERNYRQDIATDGPAGGGPESASPDQTVSVFGQDVKYLDQHWSDDERQDFYYLGQGSQLVPYLWFLSLEVAEGTESFRSDTHMRALGFIPQKPNPRLNSDGLPIGLVKDSNPSSILTMQGFLGPRFDETKFPQTHDWLGLTCAACHTSELKTAAATIRIDGGAAMADVESFLADLARSLRATADDDDKFRRFEVQVRRTAGEIDTTRLRDELRAFTPVMEALVERNKAEQAYGLGRLDAFGAILNQICAAGLEIAENREVSNAPVSYPFLWLTPELDWVQWNSSAASPISRNVGEVLGVFAHTKLTGTPQEGQFVSSARVDYLHRLETILRKLKAPEWPEEILGTINREQAAEGEKLFRASCAKCHNARNQDGEYERTAPNDFGKTFIRTASVPFRSIGTDPQMILNFLSRIAKPGGLSAAIQDDLKTPEMAAVQQQIEQLYAERGEPKPDFTKTVPGSLLLKAAVRGVVTRSVQEALANRSEKERAEMLLELQGYHGAGLPPHGGTGYKARPLAGVWATAPFGHAGSVPNLYQWLLPEDQRVKTFRVGNLAFDPTDVGFSAVPGTEGFEFRTEVNGKAIAGNSNRGHSGSGFTDFTDEQRRQIIEYIKTLE